MKMRDTIRKSLPVLVFAFALSGCGLKSSSDLDQDDVRFAGFYSDYLLLSGVTEGDEGARLTAPASPELDTLLVGHYLTRERFNFKIRYYRENPLRWRALLVQVRENIRKKTAAGR
ncbi:MAG: hypothetical protein WCH05_09600 [Chlorobiaceae bacterium]